ncbi:DUF3575 domain-containing protein [Ichthyenterobacterium magnum]|uniref:Uncharacterized protein DUF3575 n=1 Tax=Ichthyenterobacterium magnum TaxID=1230530 RepID=A0A420DWH4_9FLAO|nr:DUF3575 domain-containing protein [Ichthyenterobacterium magnum]RKE98553.1 uncharacterized protein DUF3575 [Ichthyenterobacterium magnum]
MKKNILVFLMLCSIVTINAQELEENDNLYFGKHEVKLNAIMLVVGAFEANYEYLLNDESGLGVSIFLPYDKNIKDDIQYYVSPYYRYYFGKKYAGGFFLEGFGMLNRTERNFDFIFENENENFVTDFALGIGIGGKWITKRGFVGEINYGLGRNLFKNDETDLDFVGKFGITVGYRF